jgi:hypothetical protein
LFTHFEYVPNAAILSTADFIRFLFVYFAYIIGLTIVGIALFRRSEIK